jgi:hypothetical protein
VSTETKAAPPLAARGLRALALALAGAAAAILYGLFVIRLGASAALVMLAMGGFSLVLCGLWLFRMVEPLLRPEQAAKPEAAQAPVRLRELEREKQLVLKAIREIEHDYQMRRINDDDYKTLSERYRSRALRLMRDIDAGGDFGSLIDQELKSRLAAMEAAGTAVVPPGQRVCAACALANDADASFCKKCGKAMAEAKPGA